VNKNSKPTGAAFAKEFDASGLQLKRCGGSALCGAMRVSQSLWEQSH
jgi:hypothetical protein